MPGGPTESHSASSSTSNDNNAAGNSDNCPGVRDGFYCGVVEGFYGRPWTTEQRKDLFTKMQIWGMNSYLYAPKDDCKHRAYWREPYTVEEADHLQSLITLASECNIDFCYAISPGLDIVYSSSKEVATLKRKLDQVAQLGCKAFALLFDDIEPEMCKQDKEVFQSFAQAQVSVTNEIFEYLGRPKFLFCPTQYCNTRAVPSVRNSEYLQTLGSKLAPEIQVMWTGDKVIPKTITLASLEDITEVLKRPCIIWDNEHANDYDHKRVYLGPYSGRSPDIITKLGGVMLNPNCEYGANFVAIHTLAQWSRCSVDGTMPNSNDAISADIKLEIQTGDDGVPEELVPSSLPSHVYHPKVALMKALNDWIAEFSRQKTVWGPMSKPQVGLSQPPIIPTTSLTTPGLMNVGAPLALSVTNAIAGPLSSIGSSNGPTSTLSSTGSLSQQSTTPITGSHENIAAGIPAMTASTVTAAAVAAAEAGVSFTKASAASSGNQSVPQTPVTSDMPTGLPVPPLALPMMNSLVSTNKVVVDHAPIDTPSAMSGDTIMSPAAAAATVLGSGGGPVAAAAAAASVLSTDPMTVSVAMAHAVNVVSSNVVGVTSVDMVNQGSASGASNSVGVPSGLQRVIPVSTASHLEPMDCFPLTSSTSAVTDDEKIDECDGDLNMESCTNPPTPAGSMQMEADGGTLHKAESTTMLCEPSSTTTPATTSPSSMSSHPNAANKSAEEHELSMLCDDHLMSHSPILGHLDEVASKHDKQLNVKDLHIICQLFYLPSEHGQVGIELLNDFHWLKRNANAMLPSGSLGSGSKEDRLEWERRALKFQSKVSEIERIFLKLCDCDNRELVYDLYTYIWDMCCVIQTLEGFVQWVYKGVVSPKCQSFVIGQQTWFSGIREAFISGDHEPWVFRGGLVSDLVRLLPLDSGSDLYVYKHPDVPASLIYRVRPYQPRDQAAIYRLVAEAYEEAIDAPMGLCPSDRQLIGDHAVGAYLTLSPEFCFVCENSHDGSIVAYAVASADAKVFHSRYHMAWLPEMREKYRRKVPDSSTNEEVMLSPVEELAQSFHNDKSMLNLPTCVFSSAQASSGASSTVSGGDTREVRCGVAKMRLASSVSGDMSIAKRLTMLMLSCMRASGTMRLYVEVPRFDIKSRDFFATLGFMPQGAHAPGAVAAAAASLVSPSMPPPAVPLEPASGAPMSESEMIYMTRNF